MASHKIRPIHALYALSLGLCITPALLLTAPRAPAQEAQAGAATGSVKAGVDAWTRKDYAAAVRHWRGPAAAGDPDAAFDLGQAYKLGRGVPQDLAKAEALFGQAAAKGHREAADNYGLLLFQRGAHAQAMPYIQAAAGRGEPRAEYLLGIAYFNADNVEKDWVRAYAYETLAQQAGLAQAKTALAQMDTYIPMAQRQQGVALASDLATQAESARMHDMAASTLGGSDDGGVTAGDSAAPPAPQPAPAQAYADPAPPQAPAQAYADPVPPAPPPPPPPPPTTRQPAHVNASPGRAEAEEIAAVAQSTASRVSSNGPWMVQLGAFAVPANAEAQWERLRTMVGVAGHARRLVSAGRVQRLLATGYSEAAAKTTCSHLNAAGIACLVVKN